MVKMTFSLDDDTVARLRKVAQRQQKPQSWVVREAVADYAAKADMLAPAEQERMLQALERLRLAPVEKTSAEVDEELADLRRSRRSSGRRHPQP